VTITIILENKQTEMVRVTRSIAMTVLKGKKRTIYHILISWKNG